MMKRYSSSGKRASRERPTLVVPKLRAPLLRVVTDCVEFLKDDIPEFVFRVPGRKDVVDELVEKYEHGEPNALSNFVGVEPNDVASLFKKYLMESNTPIFLQSQAQQLVRTAAKVDMTQTTPTRKSTKRQMIKFNKSLRVLTRTLSSSSAAILAKVFNFLRLVAANKDYTKMSVHALAICFAPVFFLPHFSAQEATAKIHVAIFVTETLISRADSLFPMYRRIALGDGADPPGPGLRESISRRQQQVLLEGMPRRRATVLAAFEHDRRESTRGTGGVSRSSTNRSRTRGYGTDAAVDAVLAAGSKRSSGDGADSSLSTRSSSESSSGSQSALTAHDQRRRLYTRSVDARGRPDRVDHSRQSWLHELEPFLSGEVRALKERVSRKRTSARPTVLILEEDEDEEDDDRDEEDDAYRPV